MEAARRRAVEVAGLDAAQGVAEASRIGQVVEPVVESFGDGPALELEHLQAAGDVAADDAKAGPASRVPALDLVSARAGGLELLPGVELGPLCAVLAGGTTDSPAAWAANAAASKVPLRPRPNRRETAVRAGC